MKPAYAFIACFFYLSSAVFAFAEYYHYVDKNGIKHYTDNILEVPENLRSNLSIYKSIQGPSKKKPAKTKSKITPEFLVIKKDDLDNEYAALVKKRADLMEQKKTVGEKKYNLLAAQLNIAIKQYQEKSAAYEKLVEQYNNQVGKP
ncbi:MAG: DUF4124 domain-containing protein [Deltaproteobacteria bacterium]|nr:DUF4124 domain-containing protein [Deltaproteobacteria bacterium]